jgi:hypothetical protein
MKKLLGIVGVIGMVILTSINIVAIGYGLYLWGSVGHEFSFAVWEAFKIWIQGILIGIILLLPAIYVGVKGEAEW